jgi:hypothetical protein
MVAQGIQEKEGVDISQLLGLGFAENLGAAHQSGSGKVPQLGKCGKNEVSQSCRNYRN